MWELVRHVDVVNALWYALLKLWVSAFGDGIVAVRLLPVLFSAATLPFVYATTARLAGARAAWYATFLCAASYPFLVYATVARGYAGALFGVALATWGFVRLCDRPGRRAASAYAGGIVLAALFHAITLFFVAGMLATAPLLRPSHAARRALALGLGIAAVPVVLLLLAIAREGDTQAPDIPATWPIVRAGLLWLAGGFTPPPPPALWWLSGALAVAGAVLAVRSRRTAVAAAWLVVPLVLVVAAAHRHGFFVPRYVRFALLPGAVLGGLAAGVLDRRARVVALAVALAFATLSIARAAHEPYFDWAALVAGIEARARSGDAVLVDSSYAGDAYRAALRARGGAVRAAVVYPTRPIETLLAPANTEPLPDPARLAAAHPRLWVVVWAPTTGGFVPLDALRRAYRTSTAVRIGRFPVLRFER